MSLIQGIKSRRFDDLINEGARVAITGTAALSGSSVTLLSLLDPPDTGEEGQSFILTGYQLSSDEGSPIEVALGFDDGTTVTDFFTGFVGGGQVIDHALTLGDWIFSDLGDDIVITAGSGTFAFTIDGRIIRGIKPLGYIQQIGSKEHANPVFPPDNGRLRGQSEF